LRPVRLAHAVTRAAEYKETVEGCLESAQQMRRLTESLLALARFDAGQEQLVRRPIDLAEVVRAQVAALRPLAEQRGIAVELKVETAPLHGDAERLGQVVANLVSNAIHYTHVQGTVWIETSGEGREAVLVVSDNGPGIASEDLPHVFERFYRADKARSRAEGRSGLRLAICKAIVDAHGGTLAVESTLGQGARFTMRVRQPENGGGTSEAERGT
jgi:two-component system OmpR family sensor kinase